MSSRLLGERDVMSTTGLGGLPDLVTQLRDPEFVRDLNEVVADFEAHPKGTDGAKATLQRLLQLCNYNPSLLVPYYWPDYPQPGKGMSLMDRPFQIALMEVIAGLEVTVRAGRQIGKSSILGVRSLLLSQMMAGYRILYVAPHPKHLETQQNRTQELQRSCRMFRGKPPKGYRLNLGLKEFPNGSLIEMIRVLTDSFDARGKTADEIQFDEYQLFDIDLQADVEQAMRASRVPIRLFSGTSTTVDSPLEVTYQDGSRGTWHIKSDGRWLDMGDPEVLVSCIREDGMRNPHTGSLIDVRAGQFVHADMAAYGKLRRTYHVPQVIVPDFAMKPFRWMEIFRDFTKYTREKFLQEVCGIPSAEGEREITVADLKAICNPEWSEASMLKRLEKNQYAMIVSGCDWGGSDYNPVTKTKTSFTVHVIMGITQDGYFDILHMRQYSGMDYRDIAHSIVQTWKRYRGTAVASDFGGGAAYNNLIREMGVPSLRHLVFSYSGPNSAPFAKPSGYSMLNQYSLNRTEAITTLYDAVKRKRIRCYRWEESSERLMEFMNLHRIPSDGAHGATTFLYQRNPSKPDDTLHACNFAYALGRILINEPIVNDRHLLVEVRAMLLGDYSIPHRGLGPVISG